MEGKEVPDCTFQKETSSSLFLKRDSFSCDSSVSSKSNKESLINFETHSTDVFPAEDRDRIIALAKQIRTQLLCRERPVETGCVIKIPLSSFVSDHSNDSTHIYLSITREI